MTEKLSVFSLEALSAELCDFVINGKPLRPALKTQDVSMLNKWTGIDTVQQLLLNAPSDSRLKGKIQIYGCRECLDFYCGGIAVQVTKIGDRIHWSKPEGFLIDWGPDGYDSPILFESIDVGPFDFDLVSYAAALRAFLTESSVHGEKSSNSEGLN